MRQVLTVFALLAAGGTALPATAATRSFEVGGFTEIGVSGSYDVAVRTGAEASVRAEGDEDDLDRLKVATRGGRLVLETKRTGGFDMFRSSGPVRVLVTVPRLEAASLMGSGDVTVDRMEGKNVTLSIAGSGDLKVGAVKAEEAAMKIAGSGDLTAAGTCRAGSISIAGSGNVGAGDLSCRTLSVNIAGSGDAVGRASETAAVNIRGSGDVKIGGGARCTSSVRGSGNLSC